MKITFSIVLILLSHQFYSQTIQIKTSAQTESNFEKSLMAFEGMKFYDFKFINTTKVNNPNYRIILSEYVNGKVISQKDLIVSNPNLPIGNFKNAELQFSILSKYTGEKNFKIMFTIDKTLNYIKVFDVDQDDKFDLKMFANPTSEFEIGKKHLLCAIVKPIKIAENTYRDCDFNSASEDYKDWFRVFGLNKYYTFEILFEN